MHPTTLDFAAFLARLPKAELHVHVVGALRPSTLAELAAKRGIPLPRPAETLYRYRDFYDFIAIFRAAGQSLVAAADFARAAYEYVETAATVANLRHVELFFNPGYHYPQGVAYRTQLEGLVAGLADAERDFGTTALLVPSFDREYPMDVAERVLDDVLAHRHEIVAGVGIDGPEDKGPPERFAALYARAGRAGLKRTAHVCEDYAPIPASNYLVCRDVLGCDRLDHGYRLVNDAAVVARARDDGLAFTCCPKPSTRERDPVRFGAIKAMFDAGLAITLATDDPLMFETDLADAYRRFCVGAGLAPRRAADLALASIDASWLDADRKRALRASAEAEIAALLAQVAPDAPAGGPTQ